MVWTFPLPSQWQTITYMMRRLIQRAWWLQFQMAVEQQLRTMKLVLLCHQSVNLLAEILQERGTQSWQLTASREQVQAVHQLEEGVQKSTWGALSPMVWTFLLPLRWQTIAHK